MVRRIGGHEKLVGFLPADVADPAFPGESLDAAAVEDPLVGGKCLGKEIVQILVGTVEGVGVVHVDLLGAHQPVLGSLFVAELDLKLVEEQGQLPVGAQGLPHQLHEGFLVGGGNHQLLAVAVAEGSELADPAETAAAPPDLRGGDHGNVDLLATQAAHLLGNYPLDVLQHPHSQGKKGVQSLSHPAHEPGPVQQGMARRPDRLGSLPERLAQHGGVFHSLFPPPHSKFPHLRGQGRGRARAEGRVCPLPVRRRRGVAQGGGSLGREKTAAGRLDSRVRSLPYYSYTRIQETNRRHG